MKGVVKESTAAGIVIKDLPIPEINDDQVLVEVKAAGICGSDVHMFDGLPNYEWVAPYMPVVIGHEYAGQVAKVGRNVTKVKPGDRVACRVGVKCGQCFYCQTTSRFCLNRSKNLMGYVHNGGMEKYSVLTEDGCIKIPDNVSWIQAALIEPMGISANAVYDAHIDFGDVVVVLGPGTIGLMTMLFAKASGAGRCIICGTTKDKAARLEVAKELGADEIIISDEVDAVSRVKELTGGYGADVVLECTGVPSLIQTGLDMLTKEGRLCAVGIYPKEAVFQVTQFVRDAKKIVGSYGPGKVTWERLITWLSSSSYYASKVEKIVSHRTSIKDAQAAFERCVNKENIKEMFTEFE